ncbi:hypothetical protein ASPZODRAFT_128623 [Penicilliopsis zonata CBS 506.65]|uniref:Rhodopsin domain-containing protein n=1 Tax=Penicilliopsis zonata CBS 506.65 TaxID=1073090 RepID=A0A1L9SSC7_9EURO|nr:hypothetical protein ASPZODRAFT_128623 [Penicilliopsis zonata CBS 506.65]OJJ50033.1 hypothetical protein ASPZODRAFT_128623 [Penicilliopsis zonata CBS 506.65]
MALLLLAARGGLSPTEPPDIQTAVDDNPTLLMSWWATGFSLAIIAVRVCGRYVRTERFFTEDKVMMASVVPLLARMAFVHVILLWGTNNTKTAGLTAMDIRHREIGSRLVLVSRILYAVFIWTAKYTVCEFLRRVSGMIWRRSLLLFLRFIYYFLASTFLAVVIATLAECQPFDHYWKVVPDPGPRCRCGYANLITMGACDVVTDLLLVAFPIPMILTANMALKRKVSLVLLFALSLILVGITCYRVPSVIWRDGSQQYRSLMASLEILAATAVSNAVVIGSFVRDRGVKKQKFKKDLAFASVGENIDQSTLRRATVTYHQWGSDSHLAGDLGIRLDPELYHSTETNTTPTTTTTTTTTTPGLPPFASIASPVSTLHTGALDPNWSFTAGRPSGETDDVSATDSLDVKVSPHEYLERSRSIRNSNNINNHSSNSNKPLLARHPSRGLSIFDIGGLLDPAQSSMPGLASHGRRNTQSRDLTDYREGGVTLQDVGGLLSDNHPETTPTNLNPVPPTIPHSRNTSNSVAPPYRPSRDGPTLSMELQDVGGLLSRPR